MDSLPIGMLSAWLDIETLDIRPKRSFAPDPSMYHTFTFGLVKKLESCQSSLADIQTLEVFSSRCFLGILSCFSVKGDLSDRPSLVWPSLVSFYFPWHFILYAAYLAMLMIIKRKDGKLSAISSALIVVFMTPVAAFRYPSWKFLNRFLAFTFST